MAADALCLVAPFGAVWRFNRASRPSRELRGTMREAGLRWQLADLGNGDVALCVPVVAQVSALNDWHD